MTWPQRQSTNICVWGEGTCERSFTPVRITQDCRPTYFYLGITAINTFLTPALCCVWWIEDCVWPRIVSNAEQLWTNHIIEYFLIKSSFGTFDWAKHNLFFLSFFLSHRATDTPLPFTTPTTSTTFPYFRTRGSGRPEDAPEEHRRPCLSHLSFTPSRLREAVEREIVISWCPMIALQCGNLSMVNSHTKFTQK